MWGHWSGLKIFCPRQVHQIRRLRSCLAQQLFDLLFNKCMLVWHTLSTLFNTHYHTLLNTASRTVWPPPTTLYDQLWRHVGPTMFVNLTPALCSTPIVPQLSKCLKFEAGWGVLTDQMIWIWTKRYNKTHECIVLHRMAHHNHLIDAFYLLSSFVKLMAIESLKSFT